MPKLRDIVKKAGNFAKETAKRNPTSLAVLAHSALTGGPLLHPLAQGGWAGGIAAGAIGADTAIHHIPKLMDKLHKHRVSKARGRVNQAIEKGDLPGMQKAKNKLSKVKKSLF